MNGTKPINTEAEYNYNYVTFPKSLPAIPINV